MHSCCHTALSEILNRIVRVKITMHYQLICTIFLPIWGLEYCCLVSKTGWCQRRMTPSGGRHWSLFVSLCLFMFVGQKDHAKKMKILASLKAHLPSTPCYSHSFSITENYVILIHQPLFIKIMKLAAARLLQVTFKEALFFDPSVKVSLCCLLTPGLSKDFQCHVWPYYFCICEIIQVGHQATSEKGGQPGDLQIATLIFLKGLFGYVWVNILTLSCERLCKGTWALFRLEKHFFSFFSMVINYQIKHNARQFGKSAWWL